MKDGQFLDASYQVQVRPQGEWVNVGGLERYDTPAVRRAIKLLEDFNRNQVRILETMQTVYPPDGKEW